MPKKTVKKSIIPNLLAQELDKTTEIEEDGRISKITKREALIRKMVNEAIKGDQRMLANIMKELEKPDGTEEVKKEEKLSESDEDIILRYYDRNREKIEKMIRQRKKKYTKI